MSTKTQRHRSPSYFRFYILPALYVMTILLGVPDAHGWFSATGTPFIKSTHDTISSKAFSIVQSKLHNDFLRSKANYVSPSAPGYLWYSYTPDNDANAHGSGVSGSIVKNEARNGGDIDRWFDLFIAAYKQGPGHYLQAEEYLGYCIHLIEDMSVPAHAFNIPHSFSDFSGFYHTGDNVEWQAVGYPVTLNDVAEVNPPPANPARYYYDNAKQHTIDKVKNEGFEAYWVAGVEGVDDVYEHDGARGHYGSLWGVDDSFTVLPASRQQAFVLDQVNYAAGSVGAFLLGVDRILSADSIDEDAYEENDTVSTATDITVPFHQVDLKCKDNDYYRIWVQADEKIRVTLDSVYANGDIDVALLDPSGYQVAGSTSSTDHETIAYGPLSTSGYYYVKVYGYLGATNKYTLDAVTYTTTSPDLRSKHNNSKDGFVTEGNDFWVSHYIYNSGLSTAPASHARFYLSVNSDYGTSNDYYLGEVAVASLPPLSGQWVTKSFVMPHLGSGSYSVWKKVLVDSRDEVPEELENNSFVSTAPLTAYGVRTLIGLTVVGAASVNESSSSGYSAIATWSDGTTSIVNPVWSENSSYATISAAGILTTSAVTGSKLATITASYSSGGVSRSGALTVTIADVTATLTALYIHGPEYVTENGAAAYLATAEWSNGTATVVTPTWGENSSYASIDSGGVVKAGAVPYDVADVVTASYSFGGVTRTVTKQITILNADAVPDGFTFAGRANAPLNSAIVSNAITVSGINTPAAISVTGGSYSINGGPYTTAAGTVANGSTVTVKLTSSPSYATLTRATLTVGGVSSAFDVTTIPSTVDTTPAPFSFTPKTNVPVSTLAISNSITVSGINSPAAISISGGAYSVNGGPYTSGPGTVNNGNSVAVRVMSAASYSTTTTATLTIGGVTASFSATTVAAPVDTTPDPFSFPPKSSVAVNTLVTSNAITVTGITAPAPISITGGSYSINGGVYTSAPGTVANGSTVTVRVNSSASYATSSSAILNIGGASASFVVTTAAASVDTTPVSFSLTPKTDAAPGATSVSNTITVSGINAPAAISITGGSYSVNGGPFTSTAGTVQNGSRVAVRVVSPASFGTTVTATLTIGGVSGTFSVTTRVAPDSTPGMLTFTPQGNVPRSALIVSNTITVSGLNAPAPVCITGGSYSINRGAYTTAPGSVTNGSTLTVRVTSAPNYATSVSATVVVGGAGGTFTATTIPQPIDTTPNPFSFTPQGNLIRGALATSNSIAVTGINAPAPVTVQGGAYSINGGAYTSTAGTVASGDTVTLRVTASNSFATATGGTLVIGGTSATFTVTTAGPPVDAIPAFFSFTPQTGVATGTVATSNPVTITAVSAPVPISITGGTYSINGGTFTSAPGVVAASDSLRVRVTAAPTPATVTTATVIVGGGYGLFSVTSR